MVNLKASIQQLARWKSARRVYATLSSAPLFGPTLRRLVRQVVPADTRIWLRIAAGVGKGLWANLDPRFEMSYAEGRYESTVQEVLSKYLNAGSVFYDVGAHIGIESMFAARLVEEQGTVFAFEADPRNVTRIEEHIRRNKLGQIHVVPCAVWSSQGKLSFARASAESSRNQGAVAGPAGGSGENIIQVDAVVLDDFVKRNAPPTLIKIDVEGAEAEVLRGGQRVFSEIKPTLICEVHSDQAAAEVLPWILQRDYAFGWLEDSPEFPRHLLATPKR